jgi:hypothetical protein
MTKINHYDVAEELNHQGLDGDGITERHRDKLTATAQVHATLALADAVRNLSEILVERL